MSPRRFTFALTLLSAVLIPRRGDADSIPWSYQWSAQPIVIDADPLGPDNKPSGGITLTPGAITIMGGKPGVALGNINIVAVNLKAFNFAPSPDGKPFEFTNSPYSLGVTLTDVSSQTSGTLGFSGVFNGSFTPSKMNVSMHFTSAIWQSLILGKNRYTVNLNSYTPPQAPQDGGMGSISAFVGVEPVSAPEPASLILAGMALAGVAFSWFRRSIYPKYLFHG